MIPRKKYDKIELDLFDLVYQRREINTKQSRLNDELGEVNRRIRKIMKKMKKRTKETPFGIVRVIRVKSITWLEERILAWYDKKGYKPPVKKILDLAKLEKDIERGKVKRSMLEDWTDVTKGDPYIRVDGGKK